MLDRNAITVSAAVDVIRWASAIVTYHRWRAINIVSGPLNVGAVISSIVLVVLRNTDVSAQYHGHRTRKRKEKDWYYCRLVAWGALGHSYLLFTTFPSPLMFILLFPQDCWIETPGLMGAV